jgi:hypothetical protein
MKPTPKNCSTVFKVGDIVIATDEIRRVDGESTLRPGETARVSSVFRATPDSPQIIGLDLGNRMPMGDIVCFESGPLKLAPKPVVQPGYSAEELDRDNPYNQHLHE